MLGAHFLLNSCGDCRGVFAKSFSRRCYFVGWFGSRRLGGGVE
jgi:hypothetical protein